MVMGIAGGERAGKAIFMEKFMEKAGTGGGQDLIGRHCIQVSNSQTIQRLKKVGGAAFQTQHAPRGNCSAVVGLANLHIGTCPLYL